MRTSKSRPHIYRPQRSCGQGNIFKPVCHSVHRGGLPQCMLGYQHPPDQTHTPPNRQQTPQGSDNPPADTPRDQTPPPRADTLPPPKEADSTIRSTSGRYASYWNAFLFNFLLNNRPDFTYPCSSGIRISVSSSVSFRRFLGTPSSSSFLLGSSLS